MEPAARRWEFLEEESALWRQHYDDEERRIEEEYQRDIAELEETFRKAAEAIKLDFAARIEEVKKQYSGENVSEKPIDKLNSVFGPNEPLSACTASTSQAAAAHQKILIQQSKPIDSKRVVDAVYVLPNVKNRTIECDEYGDDKGTIDVCYFSNVWQSAISTTQKEMKLQFGQCYRESCTGSRQCVLCTEQMIAIVFRVHDPGGIICSIRPSGLMVDKSWCSE